MAARVLDLFSGAGGAALGYKRAGFWVLGVDNVDQPGYAGDDFVKADAFEFLAANWWKFAAIHASPPCQRYSLMSNCRPGLAQEYPDHIARLTALLNLYHKPYIVENVSRAPLRDAIMLCGTMFGHDLYRHRLFATNFRVKQPPHPTHTKPAVHPSEWEPGKVMSVVGNCSPVAHAREIMDIDWMSCVQLSEAIPPYYTEYVGDFLRRRLNRLARTPT